MKRHGDEIVTWKACLRVLVCVLVAFLVLRYWGAVEGALGLLVTGGASIFIGMVIAYVVNLPMRFFEKKLPAGKDGSPRSGASMALALLLIVGLLIAVLLLVIPQLVQCVMALASNAPAIVGDILSTDLVASVVPDEVKAQILSIDWEKLVNDVASWLQAGVMQNISEIASLFGRAVAVGMGFVFAMMFLGEKRRLGSQAHRLVRAYFGDAADERFSRAIALLDRCFGGFIVGQAAAAAVMGLLTLLSMWLLGLPYAEMISALVCVLTMVPMVGAIIAMVLGALLILSVSWQQALIFLVVNFALQQVFNTFISPRIIGKYVQLDGMWTLVGITLGIAFCGIPGAFVGVPLLAAAKSIVSASLARREERAGEGSRQPLIQDAVRSVFDDDAR